MNGSDETPLRHHPLDVWDAESEDTRRALAALANARTSRTPWSGEIRLVERCVELPRAVAKYRARPRKST